MEKIVGLKKLRENLAEYVRDVGQGTDYIVVRRSKPLFRITPIDREEDWETVVDFTKIKKGGVNIKELLSRL